MMNKKSAPLKSILIVLGVVLAAAAVIFFTMNPGKDEKTKTARKKSIVGVKVARVERRDLSAMRVFSGTLEAEKQYDAAAKVGGRIQEIAVSLGQCLNRGDLIARLDSEEYQQQVEQARAELDVTRASLAQARNILRAAERSYERATKLREQKVSSVAELEEAETEKLSKLAGVNLVQAQIKQREAALQTAELRLSYTTLTADWQAGDNNVCRYVARRYVDEGDTISANEPVVALVDLSLLKAVINVAERDYAFLQTGQAAQISVDSIADQTFPGKVVRMAPVFEATSRQARVEIAVPNPDSLLKSGMFARVHIELDHAEQTLAAPTTAIIQRQGTYGVFIVEEDTARFVAVNPGIEDDGWTQIAELKEGEQVVTLGHHLLSDGVPVSTSDGDGTVPEKVRE